VRRDVNLSNKTLSAEQKAKAEKLRARVAKLTAELEQKATELAASRAQLAELEGTHSGAALFLNRIEATHDGKGVAHVLGKLVGGDRGEARTVTVTVPPKVELNPVHVTKPARVELNPVHVTTLGTVKRVDPSGRVEISIGSDHPKKPAKPESVEIHAV